MSDANTDATNAPLPWLPIAAAVGAAVLGPLVCVGMHLWFRFVYIAAVLVGLGIGAAVHYTSGRGDPRLAWLAVALTVVSTLVGFVWVDQSYITWFMNGQTVQPTLGDTFARLSRDLTALLFLALGGYLAYIVARRPRSPRVDRPR